MAQRENVNKNNNTKEELEQNINYNNAKDEYEEEPNQVTEEGVQEFAVAFDIQISDGSFILLVGKTEENKLILRLVDKEDETKPSYQNEFSLNELKEMNSYFNIFNNENDAINCIIKNLNESEKEIEIIDDNNIKLSVGISEDKKGSKIVFSLFKIEYVIEGDEIEQKNIENKNTEEGEQKEEEMANLEERNNEGIEEIENGEEFNYNDNYIDTEGHVEETNLEYSEENFEKSGKKDRGSGEKISNEKKTFNKEQINKNIILSNISPIKNNSKNNQNENKLQTILEETNENNLTSPKDKEDNKNLNQIKNEIKPFIQDNDNSIPDAKISKVIQELKNNLDSLGGAMHIMEQEENDEIEQNTNGNKIKKEDFILLKNEIVKSISLISDNFNKELKKQNDNFKKMQKDIKEENEKKINEIKNELKKKDNQIKDIKKLLNEKILSMGNNLNIDSINNKNKKQDKEIPLINNNDLEKIKNDINTKIKDIEQKVNDVKNNINKNNRNNDNLNNSIKNYSEKVNNLDNKLKSFEIKIKNIENLKDNNNDNKLLLDKINNLENKSKDFENKISNLEKNTKNNPSSDDEIKEIFEKMENLEKIIDQINNNNILNKINNFVNTNKKYDNEIKSLNRRVNLLENKNNLKQSNENNIKQDKNPNETFKKITITNKPNSNINEEPKRKIPKQKSNQQNINNIKNNININNNELNEIVEKNYRVIKNSEENNSQYKKYISQTFNKGNISSRSVNKNNIKKNNILDKNNINSEYQTYTKHRPRSKDLNKNNEIENIQDSQQSNRSKKNPDINTPISKEYQNSLTESKIVEYEDIIFVENRIKEIYPKLHIEFNLVYRATEDGDKSIDFHNKCDKIGPNLTIVKTKKGYAFGGFTVKNWEHLKRDINVNKPNLGSASRDPKAFGFCVNLQKIYNNEKPDEFAIWCNRNFGPTFKNNFFQIFDNFFKKGGYCSVKNNSHFSGQEYNYEISGGEPKFIVEEIEVYEIIFQ